MENRICTNCSGTGEKEIHDNPAGFAPADVIVVCSDCGGTGRLIEQTENRIEYLRQEVKNTRTKLKVAYNDLLTRLGIMDADFIYFPESTRIDAHQRNLERIQKIVDDLEKV